MKIGILTGGGDCPGLNAAIRSIVKCGTNLYDDEFVGVLRGWEGLVGGNLKPLSPRDVSGLLIKGGTILYSSRETPFTMENGISRAKEVLDRECVDALIVLGGNGTLTVAHRLFSEHNFPVIGIPKTIDNDVAGTDISIGHLSACNIATEAVDRIHSTAESHDRVIIVEVMGRDSGWIAARAGIAGGGDVILVPEDPISPEMICEILERRRERGKRFSIIVVAEGYPFLSEGNSERSSIARDEAYDPGTVSFALQKWLLQHTDFDVRPPAVLSYTQRGGTPKALDRILATKLGSEALRLAHNRQFGRMAVVKGLESSDALLKEVLASPKCLPQKEIDIIRSLVNI